MDYVVKRPFKLPVDNETVELSPNTILLNKEGRMWEQLRRTGYVMEKVPENFDWVCKKEMQINRDGKIVIVTRGDLVPEAFLWSNASAHERQGYIEKKAKVEKKVEGLIEFMQVNKVDEIVTEPVKFEIAISTVEKVIPIKRNRGRPSMVNRILK